MIVSAGCWLTNQVTMYSFPYYKEKDHRKVIDFIHNNPFAFISGCTSEGQQVATQIPVLLDDRDGELFLQGHIMRNTDHHKAFTENPNTLIVFSGPHAYVSASWYSDPHIGSTWNYMSVHVRGQMQFMTDDQLVQFMRKFTLKFEGGNTHSPTYYDNLPDDFIRKMMPGIMGFEMRAEHIDHVFKLSQNRDEESYRNIMARLETQGGNGAGVAKEMKNRLLELFPPVGS